MDYNISSRDPRLQMRINGLPTPQAEHAPTGAVGRCSASDQPHDPLQTAPLAHLPSAAPRPPSTALSGQLDGGTAGAPPVVLFAENLTHAAQAGPAHDSGPPAAAPHAAFCEQQADSQAAGSPALQSPADVNASSLGTASTTSSAGFSVPDANQPPPADTAVSAGVNWPAAFHAANQPPPVDAAASACAGWQPAADQDNPPTYIKMQHVSKRAAVPKRVVGIPFGGKDCVPILIQLRLLAPGGLLLSHIERRTHDGLDIPKRVRDVLQLDCPQAAGQATFVVLQRMAYGGEVKPTALGVRYLAASEVTPEIEQAAAHDARVSSPQRQQQGRRAPKRRRKASVCPQTGLPINKRPKKASLKTLSAGPAAQPRPVVEHTARAEAAAVPCGSGLSPSALPLVAFAHEDISCMCSLALIL